MKDIVCGMEVNSKSPFKSEWSDKIYHFCSQNCQTKFIDDPYQYVEKEPIKECCSHEHHSTPKTTHHIEKENKATQYTCPMHPEIIRQEVVLNVVWHLNLF